LNRLEVVVRRAHRVRRVKHSYEDEEIDNASGGEKLLMRWKREERERRDKVPASATASQSRRGI